MRFEELPIISYESVYVNGWHKNIPKSITIKDLLEVWDIDDPEEMSEIAQVLRHLRNVMQA